MASVQSLLGRHGLDALIVYSDAGNAANVRYLTNHRPFFGPGLLVVRAGGSSVLINRFNWDAPRAKLESGLDSVLSGFATADLVRESLRNLAIASHGRLGLAGGDLIPHRLYCEVFGDRAGEDRVDITAEYEKLRLTKSEVEQQFLRAAAEITDAAIRALVAVTRRGTSERELAATLEYEMKRRGADGLAFPASVASGPNTEKPVSLPSDRRLEPGDLVMVDVGATYQGYCADITRTFVVGEPTARQREVHSAVSLALQAATGHVQPGVAASDLHRAAVQSLEESGLAQFFSHRVGHGIGLETSLEAPDLQRDGALLEPGMTFCLEPGVYIPGFGGIKIEDDIVVQPGGPEVISTSPRDLVVVGDVT
ncbi:MAG TPA: Xaa-Pro peptidase family protein [Chloroflexota bacterium]|nr:Xaa-Pro peptidase family protein [Chloroflexota bacterium]